MEELTLTCPIRGTLKARAKSADGLSPSEERLRIDAVRHLLNLGYPAENIKIEATIKRFGNGGRNSFRCDIAALEVPASSIKSGDVESLLAHAVLLVEVKRDNAGADYAKKTQVKPMLDFAKRTDALGLYWDDIEQRVYWKETSGKKMITREGPLALLPRFGEQLNVKPLTLADTAPTDSLTEVFERIEDLLHSAAVDAEDRYNIILQLLLAKLYDETSHEATPDAPLAIQDPAALQWKPALVRQKFDTLLDKATKYYGRHLPRPVSNTIGLDDDRLSQVLEALAPIRITASRNSVIQSFYMKFAKHLYRWDMAQYFTPTTVTDFIVTIANPQFGEHVKDPACGSADFLTAAFRLGKEFDRKYADCVWGSDTSTSAVQVAVLNMLLNGDGKSNIVEEDSLEATLQGQNAYNILVCNPPFGTKIVEQRNRILREYDLGHSLEVRADGSLARGSVREKQETGLLFAEVCVKQTVPAGRIAIILPNGYLGNRSQRYQEFREWLLRQCRLVSICSFPRFTFKSSGADVSASVVYLEKRASPLTSLTDDDDYAFNVELVESVGWNVGNKKGEPIYRRLPEDGTYLVDTEGDYILEADFQSAQADLWNSSVVADFPWLVAGRDIEPDGSGWSRPISVVLEDPTRCLDPKLHSRKHQELRIAVAARPHFVLGDLIDFIPELRTPDGSRVSLDDSQEYDYVEIQNVFQGDYRAVAVRGWELPQRARHIAAPGDIYAGAVWGSVGKWFATGEDIDLVVVTNGFHRMRMKSEMESYVVDVLAALNTEAWSVQMRAMARGSDGLAEVNQLDMAHLLVPRLSDEERAVLRPHVDQLRGKRPSLRAAVHQLLSAEETSLPYVAGRPSHSALV